MDYVKGQGNNIAIIDNNRSITYDRLLKEVSTLIYILKRNYNIETMIYV